MQGLNNMIRKKISGTRRRFNEHGYNIDLSYIVENRVIVMSYPAANFKQKMYRNDAKQVSARRINNSLSLYNRRICAFNPHPSFTVIIHCIY